MRLIEEAYFQKEWKKFIPTTPTLSVLEVGLKDNTSLLREDRSGWMLLRRVWEKYTPMYTKCYPQRFEVKGMEWVPHDNNVSPNPIPKTLIYRKSFTTSDDGDEARIPSVFTHMVHIIC